MCDSSLMNENCWQAVNTSNDVATIREKIMIRLTFGAALREDEIVNSRDE